MALIEKLGSFYLGKEYDLAKKKLLDTPVNYDSARFDDPRGLRRHDGQRQDRPVH
jgi:hypothetical protein